MISMISPCSFSLFTEFHEIVRLPPLFVVSVIS
jgi:hypothetical protein